ncbi:hypothetical protein [Vibrio gazogenes]|nr:hypothetical protein [Vibrio gazogenes]
MSNHSIFLARSAVSQVKWQRKANAKVIALNQFDRIFTAESSPNEPADT